MSSETENIEIDLSKIGEPENLQDIILNLMVNPNLSPLNYFNDFNEFIPDPAKIGSNELEESGIFELPDGNKLVSMTMHAMHHHLELDPKKAAEILISRASRRMVCFGATPVAVTALLYHINYGDPNGYFIANEAKEGLENASKAFNIKISDRKIRFDYFEEHGSQLPTIIVSMLGMIPGCNATECKPMTPSFKKKGDLIFIIGRPSDDIYSSEYLEFYHGVGVSPLPEFDLTFETKVQNAVKELIKKELIKNASPVAKGGLFFSLLRAGWKNGFGFDITTAAETRRDSFLFGESMGRIIVGVSTDKEDEFVDFMVNSKIPFFTVGHVTKGEMRIDDESYGFVDKINQSL